MERVKSMARSESSFSFSSSSSSSSKASSGSSAFSTTTEILERLDETCWACSNVRRNLQCANVVPGSDNEIKFLKTLSLLPFPIAGYENGMRLCANCHTLFDDMLNPGWIFAPADLDYFIAYEMEDRKARHQSQAQSSRDRNVPDSFEFLTWQKRTGTQSPSATMPTYTRYALGPEQWGPSALVTGDKEWHGHPLAAIRMAWRVLGAVKNDTVPIEVQEKLSRLLDLYRAPLHQHQLASAPPNNPSHDNKGGDGDGDTKEKRKGKGKGISAAGPSGTKKRSRLAAQQTLAGKRPRREGASKRQNLVFSAPTQPLYNNDDEILKWIQAVEPYHGPTTPESVKAPKKVKYGKLAHRPR